MPTLVVDDPSGQKTRVLLSSERPIVLGRDPSCDLVLVHPSISRRHAVIRYVEGAYDIHDRSTNGLFVNGDRVESHRLHDGDELILGGDSEHPIRYLAEETRLDLTLTQIRYDFSKEALSDITNLSRLIEVNKAITTSLEVEEVFELLLEGILAISSGTRAMIMTKTPSGNLETVYEKNLETDDALSAGAGISHTIVDKVVETGEPVLINDVADDPNLQAQESIVALDLRSIVAIPLHYSQTYLSRAPHPEPLMGIIYVDARSARRRFSQEDFDLLLAFSYQGAISLENAKLHRDLQENYLELMLSLAEAVEIKDRYTRGHSELVSRFSVAIAEEMELTEREIEEIERGGMLHDVGKIGIDEAILSKPGRLTDEEFEIIRMHPVYGAKIVEPISFLSNVKDMVLHHHERTNGSGYPDGLKGSEISLGARIIAVCDVFEGLTSHRPYRDPMTPEEVVALLEEEAGPILDADVVEIFLRIYRDTGYKKGEVGRARAREKKTQQKKA